jgi:acyl carrier protein
MHESIIGKDAAEAAMREWLVQRLSGYLGKSAVELDPQVPLAEYGMSSVDALSLCGDLEDELRIYVDPILVWERPTVDELVVHLAALQATSVAVAD